MVPLRDVLTPVSRSEAVDPQKTYHILGAHWYANGLYTKDVRNGSQIQAKNLYRVERGDFVYNRLFAWKGSFAVASEENDCCYVSNEFPCFVVNQDRIHSRYLWRYFSRAAVWEEALALSTGGTPTSRNRLKEERLLVMEIPLPPVEEQRRIVAKIDQVAARIEKAQRLRQQLVEQLEALSVSTLSEVFDGFLGTLPKNKLVRDSLAEVIAGQHVMANDYNQNGEGFPYITGPADFGPKIAEIKRWTHAPKTTAMPGDVLLTVKGAGVGKINFAPNNDVAIGRQLMAIRPNPAKLFQDFLFYFLKNRFSHFQSIATATTVPGFKKEDVNNLDIPILSLKKQRDIVAYLDTLQAKLDGLKQLQTQTAAELDALLPSILDKAFKGEL